MVAAEVREGGDMHLQPVETVLFQPVAAGLERKMRHAGANKRLQRGVKARRVGSRQRRQADDPALHPLRVRALKAQRAD